MSQTYSIACKDCKKHLWIGQGRDSEPDKRYIYTGNKEIMKNLKLFLFEHKGHNLVFDDKVDSDILDYEEVGDEEEEWVMKSKCRRG